MDVIPILKKSTDSELNSMSDSKTEKKKMLSGKLYDASDALLVQEQQTARSLTHRLNITEYGDKSAYQQIISSLLPNTCADIVIEPPFHCDYGYNIYTGNNVYFNVNCVLLDVMPIRIGSNVLFGPGVQLYTATHPADAEKRQKGAEYAKPITIGDDCWIGGGAIICPGITIGDRCIIGAGAVVTRDIIADTTAAGNPAKPIK